MPEYKSTTPSPLIDAISEITGALVEEHADMGAVLTRITEICAELLSAAASGIMIVDPRGGLAVVAASDERARLVELLQSQNESGPCPECIRNSEVIAVTNLDTGADRWPEFQTVATEVGYRAILAVPMILDGRAVGGLNILFTEPTQFDDEQHRRAAVLADLALLELTHERGEHRAGRLSERTLTLLNERVHLGQATGLVAGTLDISPSDARALIDDHASRSGLTLRGLARAITDGSVRPDELLADSQAQRRQGF
ncbi:GAF and ANTAR domain-containing protein [Rhodococcus qingshengii]|uniref:GAF and ANTAR domain-containing protein n=1 Tax=Rhodococcus TaxID=1827 RepID=UPI001BACEACD|nr:GAF and ANTAR domain-containing protein [Rhodococcus qingshengii]MBS3693874.1 GAF and ANTAR domain-containing protein [Rhodococcus qingshengii]